MEKFNFQKVYPFTTENIAGYITKMDIQGKSVLTLGSSCDQAFNSLLLGAEEVTVFDINERVKEFYELKRKLIFEVNRENLVEAVMNIKGIPYFEDAFSKKQLEQMNLYLENDENYKKLREILEEKNIDFITGNIFECKKFLNKDKRYDRVILSNVLQYISSTDVSIEEVYNVYKDLLDYLNDDFIIQPYYLYGNLYPSNFAKIVNKFEQNNTLLELISCDEYDSVIFAKNRTIIK